MTLLEQCQKWNEKDQYQKIIDALEAIPAQKRTPEEDSELARAYNNQAGRGDRDLFRKAIALLKPHEEYFAGDHCWNFRMGYAYFYLDQEGRALRYFEKALEARPGDEDTQEFIDWCKKGIALPRFSECFQERTEDWWETFAEMEAELRQMMDDDKDHTRGAEIVAQMEDALDLVFDEISFEMGFNGQKHELILTPEGDKVKLFELVYFQKHAPKEVLEHWNILVGRQPNPGVGLRTDDGWEISGEDVQVWLEQQGEQSFALSAYCEKLLPLLREAEGRAWWMLTTLTDQVLGEISHMRYIDDFDVLEEPKGEPSIPMSRLPERLKELGLDLSTGPEGYLENYIGYEMEPSEDPEADWRLDVIAGSTCCAPLINGYLSADNDLMDMLHADGAAAGFLCYPLDTLREEEGSDKIFAFRDELEDYLSSACGPDVLTLTGGATGIFCGYVDFIAWDLPAVLNKAQDFFADTDLPWASFHTFRREAGTVNLKTPPEEEPDEEEQVPELDETLTGMDYIPYTPENTEKFFAQIEQWNDEDEYTRCVQALNAVPEERRDYRFAYALARALENYAIIGDHDKGTPNYKGDKALLRAIAVLESVREEGQDKAEWNMRMAYGYQYLHGQEKQAIPYAQRWMELDPEDKNAPAVIRECEEELAKRSGGEPENGAEGAPAGPVLTAEDVEALESMCEGASGYFYKMLNFLEERLREGVRRGRFTWEQARGDLDTALWYSYICNNVDEYEYYYRASQWMPDSERAAEQARSGVWYYRYACALTYCGRLEEARKYAEKGVGLDPEYVWGWLLYGRLLSHFGDREGALAAADRGLALEPGDYEFTTLRREIQEGRTLEEMEFHWIDPESDRRLQAGLDESAGDKKRAISCILCRREALEEIKAALAPVEWEADAPYCTFTMPYQGGTVEGRFFGNEAALSKVPAEWVRELVRRLPELDRRGLTFLSARAGLGTGGLALERFTIQMDRRLCLFYQRGEEQQMVRFAPDFALSEEDQPALAQPEGGTFLAFVLLERPEWDAEAFKRTLRDDWGIPCMTEEKDSEDGGSTLVFEAEGFLAAVSLYPFPVPKGEAEQNAGHNYLWSEAEETARRHRGQILVSTMARDGDVGQAARLQVKLVCAACGQDGVLGIYANGTVYQPEFYLEAARMMEDGSLPLLDLVWPGLYRREGGLCAYTEGMRAFGKDELEVLDTQAEPGDLRGFVLDIASYVLEQDVTLRDGETIGFSEEQKLPITRSAGIWHDGMTLKIGYPSKEDGEDEDSGAAMDDARWHLESIGEKELDIDPINAYNHMAIYLRWCMEHDLMGEGFLAEYGEAAEKVKADPAGADLRAFIRDELDGQLVGPMFNKIGRAFASYYYGEGDSPYFPSDIDDYALRYFGPERYHSDEFRQEAYLFIPFDEDYYQAMAEVIEERFANWQGQDFDEDTREPSELAKALMEYLDCECTYFPSMKDDDPIMAAYSYARRLGVREGFIPVLIKAEETLLECLVMNADPEHDGDCYEFDLKTVTEYRKKMRSAPIKDSRAVLEELIGQRKEEAEDDDLDWDEEVLGEMEGGYENDRFSCYWDSDTGMTYPLILAKIPVKNPWEIFAYLPFGSWNDCPDTPELMAVAKYWFQQYGAVPAAMSHDELEFDLPAPVPEENAMEAALEQYGFCPDIVDQEPEDATVGALADVLRQSTVWYFWWD